MSDFWFVMLVWFGALGILCVLGFLAWAVLVGYRYWQELVNHYDTLHEEAAAQATTLMLRQRRKKRDLGSMSDEWKPEER